MLSNIEKQFIKWAVSMDSESINEEFNGKPLALTVLEMISNDSYDEMEPLVLDLLKKNINFYPHAVEYANAVQSEGLMNYDESVARHVIDTTVEQIRTAGDAQALKNVASEAMYYMNPCMYSAMKCLGVHLSIINDQDFIEAIGVNKLSDILIDLYNESKNTVKPFKDILIVLIAYDMESECIGLLSKMGKSEVEGLIDYKDLYGCEAVGYALKSKSTEIMKTIISLNPKVLDMTHQSSVDMLLDSKHGLAKIIGSKCNKSNVLAVVAECLRINKPAFMSAVEQLNPDEKDSITHYIHVVESDNILSDYAEPVNNFI